MNSKVTTVKNFRQADSRWGKLGYPTAPKWVMANCGCGATAVADIVVSNPKHTKVTPATIRKYMLAHGYIASYGHGTAHIGIPACLREYGFSVKYCDTMAEVYKEFEKGMRRGIFLLYKGTKGGVTWTSSGHFVAIAGYKKVGRNHYFLVRDPGGRHNDGWFCYETTMKGLLAKVWVAWIPGEKPAINYPKLPKRGYFKKGDKGVQVKRLQRCLKKLGYKVKVDGEIGDKTVDAINEFKAKYKMGKPGKFGKKALRKMKKLLKAQK